MGSQGAREASPSLWKAQWILSRDDCAALSELLDEAWEISPVSVSSFENEGGKSWRVEALFSEEPESALLASLCSPVTNQPAEITPLEDINWIAKSLEGLAPIHAGRFFVAGAHDINEAPQGSIPICINAGEAFGTGHHGSTHGCLLMLDAIIQRKRPHRALDLGCGSGVLAIALAKTTRAPIWASDIDPIAVAVTKENAARNQVGPLVRAVTAPGFKAQPLAEAAPFDLIVANILARPLSTLAHDMAAACTPDAHIILSGLLTTQEAFILNAYAQAGFALHRRLILGEWLTLELTRPQIPRSFR